MKKLDGEIVKINGVIYKEITLRGRTKLISKNGEVLNPKKRNQKATLHKNKDGYPCCGGGIPIHLYVAHAWVDGYFEGAEVNHKDFNRENYNYKNLEWVTHSDNVKWSVKYNKNSYSNSKIGERNGRHIFTEAQIKQIRQYYENGLSVFDIIRKLENLTTYEDIKRASSRYYYVVKNKSWKNI